MKNHYSWLNEHFFDFLVEIGCGDITLSQCVGILTSHGDKCYSYEDRWKAAGIPFEHGAALYLLSFISPWEENVRNTKNGWVPPVDWVINVYPNYKEALAKIEGEKSQ